MIDWVERGQVPDAILATQYNEDQTVKRTRPLYAYPTIARYSGSGDVNDAASWRPEQPKSVPDDRIDWIWAPKRS
jgi:feruloyl esterase